MRIMVVGGLKFFPTITHFYPQHYSLTLWIYNELNDGYISTSQSLIRNRNSLMCFFF